MKMLFEDHFDAKIDAENIVIRNRKIARKHRPNCWYFCFSLKYLGWPYREYIKTVKSGGFCEELVSENDLRLFYPVPIVPMLLRQFRRSLQIEKLSQILFMYYSLLNSQNVSINNSEKRLVTYLLWHLWWS